MSASEQTSASKREPGYYWVKIGTTQHQVYFNGQQWEFIEVDERRIERPQMDTEPSRFDIVKAMADQLGVGQPDELSKRIRDLEEELHSETNEVTYYRDLYKKADERANALAEAMRRINAITHENR